MATSSVRSAAAGLLALVVVAAATPLLWRVVVDRFGPSLSGTPSYLPSAESVRVRRPFDAGPIWGLQNMNPGIVVIGDSMAGRVDPDRLGQITNVPIAPILRNATGSGYWYLAFKNYVVASKITPERTVIFFRDTNLTDLMFRLLGDYHEVLDEVAVESEPELDRVVAANLSGPWHRVHAAMDRAYATERTRAWLEPALTAWPARVVAGSRGGTRLLAALNEQFALDRLRPMPLTDMSVVSPNDTDFHGNVDKSALPLLLSLAREHGRSLVFVRVQRRAADGGLRPESPALARYIRDLRAYIERGGGHLIDDQHDREVALLPYDDLDHISRDGRSRYTEIFARKLQALPR